MPYYLTYCKYFRRSSVRWIPPRQKGWRNVGNAQCLVWPSILSTQVRTVDCAKPGQAFFGGKPHSNQASTIQHSMDHLNSLLLRVAKAHLPTTLLNVIPDIMNMPAFPKTKSQKLPARSPTSSGIRNELRSYQRRIIMQQPPEASRLTTLCKLPRPPRRETGEEHGRHTQCR